jgi:hypothetical protein
MGRGRPETPFEEIPCKDREARIRLYGGAGYITIPSSFRSHFDNRVLLFIDKEHDLIGIQPTKELTSYQTSCWRIWCTEFLRTYGIEEQTVKVKWDPSRKMLTGKVKRNEHSC